MASTISPSTSSPRWDFPDWLSIWRKPTTSTWLCPLLLLFLCGILFFYGLNAGEFFRTEGLRAILAEGFLRSGNWLVPKLYGEPFFTKPPGMYAAIALCSLPFGAVTEWTARLPSALAATATVFLFYWYFGRQLGRLGGFLAAGIVPLSPMWLEKATSAEIDMLLVAWTTAAILFFLRGLERDVPKPTGSVPWACSESHRLQPVGLGWWLLSLTCVAGGFLTKWTTPAFFYLTVIPMLWCRGQFRLLFGWRHLVSLTLGLAICLSWVLAAVALESWQTFYITFRHEALIRLLPNYSPSPYPWQESLIHPLKLLAVTLPYSAVALWTLRPSFWKLWDEKGKHLLLALHCWVWPNMLLWSLIKEHTPRHSFPLFPAISGLAALVVFAWMTGRLRWRFPLRPATVLALVILLWIGLKLFYVHTVMPRQLQGRDARLKGEQLAQLVPFGNLLYIFQLKDEGIMFYYGREVLRLHSPHELPRTDQPLYCILLPSELEDWQTSRTIEVVQHLQDEQGDPMILVRVTG